MPLFRLRLELEGGGGKIEGGRVCNPRHPSRSEAILPSKMRGEREREEDIPLPLSVLQPPAPWWHDFFFVLPSFSVRKREHALQA